MIRSDVQTECAKCLGRRFDFAAADAIDDSGFAGVPIGCYEVRAIDERGGTVRAVARLNQPGQLVRADLTLPDGQHDLRGRARYRDGRAFDGWIAVSSDLDWYRAWPRWGSGLWLPAT